MTCEIQGEVPHASAVEPACYLQQRPDLPTDASAALGDALSLTDESIDETRHAVQRLAPPLLAELGLVAASPAT